MAYVIATSLEQGKSQVVQLAAAFRAQYQTYKSSPYSEAQIRSDFIDPLLKSLGWDVANESHKPHFMREVRQEEAIDVEEGGAFRKRNPDYTLQIEGIRKLFLEAKKPSIDIIQSATSAFQTRRYGWNGNLKISILSNFEYLVIYDCRFRPIFGEGPDVARYKVFHFEEFSSRFEELYDLLSFESISNGKLEAEFAYDDRLHQPFDADFLLKMEAWRKDFADDILVGNSGLSGEEINFLVHRLVNRIVFLRICEDREQETYEQLINIQNYAQLKSLFGEADQKYNSGLFDFVEDELSLNVLISSDLLVKIFKDLYYPQSPYDFSVIEPEILSQIYERWLGKRIFLNGQQQLSIVEEPEVVESDGIVPTPKLIVRKIVQETLEPLVEGKNLTELLDLRIADICCGSGSFLIAAFDFLILALARQCEDNALHASGIARQSSDGSWVLTLKAKKQILMNSIFGVDINPYAVEVTRFGLVLKLMEGETRATIHNYVASTRERVLPTLAQNIKCGNSLLDDNYYSFNHIPSPDLLFKLKPFTWVEEFPFLAETGGFDAILGNPPYVRIQNMVKYSKEEIEYFQSRKSPYRFAQEKSIDKYYLFLQKGIELLNRQGRLGYIVPNKFFVLTGGKALRSTIIENSQIARIIHFGATQVFPGRSTYTAILILTKAPQESFKVGMVTRISERAVFDEHNAVEYSQNGLSDNPWVFLTPEGSILFQKLKSGDKEKLAEIGTIAVGMQTSADDIFLLVPTSDDGELVYFEKGGTNYSIEKSVTVPCLWDQKFDAFSQPKANGLMIFPYEVHEGKASLIPEEKFISRFPRCWGYLNVFKESLAGRSINGKDPVWYQFGRSQSLSRFHSTEKLIWPVLSLGANYAIDQRNIRFTGGGNGPYYSFISDGEYSLLYILGILSHPAIEAMVKASASHFRGGYYSHGKQFIADLPIPVIDFSVGEEKIKHDQIVASVLRLIAFKDQLNSERLPDKKIIIARAYSRQELILINQINALFGITEADMNLVLQRKYLIDSNIE